MAGKTVKILSVAGRKLRRQFLDFPEILYRGSEQWCPPLRIEQSLMLNKKKHPFFRHGDAAFFLAVGERGETLGRISASVDPLYQAHHHDNVGCFGMFECVDDQAVAHALLDRASEWVAAQGADAIMGPVDFSVNYMAGLLVEGFDIPQRIMMAYHKPYYRALIESWGADKEQDLLAWSYTDVNPVHKWRKKIQRLAAISNVTIRPFNRKQMRREMQTVRDLIGNVLGQQWGYVRSTDAELEKARKDLDRVPPDMILIAEDGDKPIGIAVNVPDFNEVIRPIGGRLCRWGVPIGLVKLLRGMKKIKCARLAVLGVHQDYRFEGIAERLTVKSFENGRYRHGYTEAEMGWTLENNDLMTVTINKVVGPANRRYHVYRKAIKERA